MKSRKHILSVLLLVLVNSFSYSQTANTKRTKLVSIKTIIDYSGMSEKLSWDSYQRGDTSSKPIPSAEVSIDIDNFLLGNYPKGQFTPVQKELDLLKKYQPKLDSAFNELTLFGSGQLARFIYSRASGELPVSFGLQNDSALTLLVQAAYIDKIYNISQLTARQRAKETITQYLLPTLREFYEALQPNSEIRYLAISSVYGTKDFADNSFFSLTSEYVCCVVSVKALKKFIDSTITEDALINGCDVYLTERGLASQLKKIKLSDK